MNHKLKALRKKMNPNLDKWKKETNNALSNLELPMKDKERTLKTITFVKRKEPKRNMTKWLSNMSKNIDNKLRTLKKSLKMSNLKLCLLKRI